MVSHFVERKREEFRRFRNCFFSFFFFEESEENDEFFSSDNLTSVHGYVGTAEDHRGTN